MSKALLAAIAQVYEAFVDVPAPRTLDAAPHRNPKQLLKRLTSVPLAELTDDQLGSYAGWAMTTVGDASAYQHFLPRILELATGPNGHLGYEPPVVAGKVVYGRWETWRPARREAVLKVFATAYGACLVSQEPHPLQAPDDWLAGLARLTQVTGFLQQWRDELDPWAALHLAGFRVTWIEALATEEQPPPFWQDVDIGVAAEVEAWLLSIESRRQIERALPLIPPEERWQLERALPDQ